MVTVISVCVFLVFGKVAFNPCHRQTFDVCVTFLSENLLHFTLPNPAQVRQLLTTLGTTAPQLDLAAAPPIPDILAALPQDLRIIALYLAPDKCTLYMAAINVPNPDAVSPLLPLTPPAGRKDAAVTPPAAVDAAGSPIPSTITLVERGHLKSDALERLVARLRVYRRQVWQRQSRDGRSVSRSLGQCLFPGCS